MQGEVAETTELGGVSGIHPFPTGPAAPTLQWQPTERGSPYSCYQIQGAPEILPRYKDQSHGSSILLVGPPTSLPPQPIQVSDRTHLGAPSPEGILRRT